MLDIEKWLDTPLRNEGIEQLRLRFTAFDCFASVPAKNSVLITGTNGKGSTASFLSSLLTGTGDKVGLFTSPHLISANERIAINANAISKSQFVQHYAEIKPIADRLQLGRFSRFLAIALHAFYSTRLQVNAALFEVGVGGRLDPVNILPRQMAILTKIGLDHENILGSGLANIAREKMALACGAEVLVHGPLPREVLAVKSDWQRKSDCEWVEAPIYPLAAVDYDNDGNPQFAMDSEVGPVRLPMPGQRAAETASIALCAGRILHKNVNPHHLSGCRWPGRMEPFPSVISGCKIYLSGDHNPQGAESLRALLTYWNYRHLYFLVGIAPEKDYKQFLSILHEVPGSNIYFTSVPSKVSIFVNEDNFVADPIKALEKIEEGMRPGDMLVVTGSLYLIGFLREHLLQRLHLSDN